MSAATTPKEASNTPLKIKYGISGPRIWRSGDRAQIAPTPAATVIKMTRSNKIANASAKGVFELLSNEESNREVSMDLWDGVERVEW